MALPGVHGIHHIALICSDYQRSKRFYCDLLGGTVIAETYRALRKSYKLDIAFPGFELELFSFPAPPVRPSTPEAQGLRHLAIRVTDLAVAIDYLQQRQVVVEPVRIDELTGNRFTFFPDPDGLPLELVECPA
ncbi:VOC family protein [Reinekea sp.]|jgi:glyoxylase I family protein|uniref:SMU1112c/YaeR family gloxylase I-like metalloprotein n=1 Tax=Reinekea sp. TaxID=1970455 RepID=UPI002A817ABC|nr:VOC family protein [Reinekea sp.]